MTPADSDDGAAGDVPAWQDQLIVRLLVEVPLAPIPSDFARETAERASRELPLGAIPGRERFEPALWVAFALAGAVALVACSSNLIGAAGRLLEEPSAAMTAVWAVMLGACLLVTFLVRALVPRRAAMA